MNTRLFVGNLVWAVTEPDLEQLLAEHGPVSEVALMLDRDSGRSRRFGFVTMGSPEAAQTAIEAMNGKDIEGRRLTVNEARPPEERPPRRDRDRY